MRKIEQWKSGLSDGSLTHEDIEELGLHLADKIEELQARGFSEDEAWIVATNILGAQAELEEEFSKVNTSAGLMRTGLLLAWGALLFFLAETVIVIIPTTIYRNLQLLNSPGYFANPPGRDYTAKLEPAFWALTACCAIVLAIVCLKRKTVFSWLSNRISGFNSGSAVLILILGTLTAFLRYRALRPAYSEYYGTLNSFETLLVFFYGALILSTVYLSFRYRGGIAMKLTEFRKSITASQALVLGVAAHIPVQFTQSLGYLSHYLPVVVAIPVYAVASWMVTRLPAQRKNMVFLQLVALAQLGLGLVVNRAALIHFLSAYAAALAGIGIGYLLNRFRRDERFQTAGN